MENVSLTEYTRRDCWLNLAARLVSVDPSINFRQFTNDCAILG